MLAKASSLISILSLFGILKVLIRKKCTFNEKISLLNTGIKRNKAGNSTDNVIF